MRSHNSSNLDATLEDRSTIQAVSIGNIASQILLHEYPVFKGFRAMVSGVTSQGVFLALPASETVCWQIFLTTSVWHGPLTINLPVTRINLTGYAARTGWQAIQPGQSLDVFKNALEFDEVCLSIKTQSAAVWKAPINDRSLQSLNQRISLVSEIIQYQQLHPANYGYLSLVNDLLGMPPEACDEDRLMVRAYYQLSLAMASQDKGKIIEAIAPFFGLGCGLTPSGDDLVCGFLLALNRWGKFIIPVLDVVEINREICKLAWVQTNNISASLIECACQGQADERLIKALDGLAGGGMPVDKMISYLSGWGSTSGYDTLAGIALVML